MRPGAANEGERGKVVFLDQCHGISYHLYHVRLSNEHSLDDGVQSCYIGRVKTVPELLLVRVERMLRHA